MNLCAGGHTSFCCLPTHCWCSAPTQVLCLDASGRQGHNSALDQAFMGTWGLIPHGHHYLEPQPGGGQASVIGELCTFLLASTSSGTGLWVLNTPFRESPHQGGSQDALTPFLSSQPGFLCSLPDERHPSRLRMQTCTRTLFTLSWLGCSIGLSQGEILLI